MIALPRTNHDDTIENKLLKEQPLLRRCAYRHCGFQPSREKGRPRPALTLFRPIEPLLVVIIGVIEPVIERLRNPYETAPPKYFGEPHKDLGQSSELIGPNRAGLLDRLAPN